MDVLGVLVFAGLIVLLDKENRKIVFDDLKEFFKWN